jgi:glycerate kinase
MRILIVPDKFKGTLTAGEAADALASGWLEGRPGDELTLLPMSDGGDGFGEVIGRLLGAAQKSSITVNAAQERIVAPWHCVGHCGTAIIESAKIIGLAMLPPGKFHPFELDSYGLGLMIKGILREFPVKQFIIGIGGSATNDGGFGMARALGYSFADEAGEEISSWTKLWQVARIQKPELPHPEIIIATDVQNPLLGEQGATRVYGPQKGLVLADIEPAESALAGLARAVRSSLGIDAAEVPGTGAAGGLGYGLLAFLEGRFEPGFDIFARLSKLEEKISGSDLVLTAEGAIDPSTAMGKGTGAVAQMARKLQKSCAAFAAIAVPEESPFGKVYAITPLLADLAESRKSPAKYLRMLARRAAIEWNPGEATP